MAVVKTKKGKGEFYYLKNSYRKNGKVITKQVYLGKELPEEKALALKKEKLMLEQKNELNKKLELIKNNFKKEWNKTPESMKEKELKEIAIAFTYNTNAIEGSKITLEETREILEKQIAPNKPLRDIKETENHATIFLEMLTTKREITEELILKWHKKIFEQSQPQIAGKFRDYSVRVGEYRAPDWQDIQKLMKELLQLINTKEKINILTGVAKIHYKFEKIHPFGDGNGRIGRLLMNYMLWNAGYPVIIISYKKRKAYYKALTREENKFINYFIRYYLTIHKKTSKNI